MEQNTPQMRYYNACSIELDDVNISVWFISEAFDKKFRKMMFDGQRTADFMLDQKQRGISGFSLVGMYETQSSENSLGFSNISGCFTYAAVQYYTFICTHSFCACTCIERPFKVVHLYERTQLNPGYGEGTDIGTKHGCQGTGYQATTHSVPIPKCCHQQKTCGCRLQVCKLQ